MQKDEVTNKIDIKRNLHLKDDVMLGQWERGRRDQQPTTYII